MSNKSSKKCSLNQSKVIYIKFRSYPTKEEGEKKVQWSIAASCDLKNKGVFNSNLFYFKIFFSVFGGLVFEGTLVKSHGTLHDNHDEIAFAQPGRMRRGGIRECLVSGKKEIEGQNSKSLITCECPEQETEISESKTHLKLVRDGIFLVGRTNRWLACPCEGIVGCQPCVLVECQTFNLITIHTTKNIIQVLRLIFSATKQETHVGAGVPSTWHSLVESECIWVVCCRWRSRSGTSDRRHKWSRHCRSLRSVKEARKGQWKKNKNKDDRNWYKEEKGKNLETWRKAHKETKNDEQTQDWVMKIACLHHPLNLEPWGQRWVCWWVLLRCGFKLRWFWFVILHMRMEIGGWDLTKT